MQGTPSQAGVEPAEPQLADEKNAFCKDAIDAAAQVLPFQTIAVRNMLVLLPAAGESCRLPGGVWNVTRCVQAAIEGRAVILSLR